MTEPTNFAARIEFLGDAPPVSSPVAGLWMKGAHILMRELCDALSESVDLRARLVEALRFYGAPNNWGPVADYSDASWYMNGRPWMRAYAALKDSGEEVTLLAEPEPDAPERAHEELLDALTAAADHAEAMRQEAAAYKDAAECRMRERDELEQERDVYRAVLQGIGVPNLDWIADQSVMLALQIGENWKADRESTDYAEELRAALDRIARCPLGDSPRALAVEALKMSHEIGQRSDPARDAAVHMMESVMGVDKGSPDGDCTVKGYRDAEGRVHVTSVERSHAVVPKYDAFQWTGDLAAFEKWFGERLPVDFGNQISVPVHKSNEGKWLGPWLRVWCGSWVIRHEGRNHTVTDAVYKLLTQTIPSQVHPFEPAAVRDILKGARAALKRYGAADDEPYIEALDLAIERFPAQDSRK